MFYFHHRCILKWIADNWTPTVQRKINERLLELNLRMPSEIHRTIRSLDDIKRWKGTEFRTILLYVGIVVFKDFLSNDFYQNFLQLFCAVTICYTNSYKMYIPIAKQLFDEYVENYIALYGTGDVTSNVHNLCHITEDVSRFGNLNEISTYEFENTLGEMKNRIKKCHKPLEQISRRMIESFNVNQNYWHDQNNFTREPSVKYSFQNSNEVECFNEIDFEKKFKISNRKLGDNFFMTKDNEIVQFKYVTKSKDSIRIFGFSLKIKGNFFEQPCYSKFLNIHVSNLEKLDTKCYTVESIKCKLICLNYGSDYILMPLLHSLE